MSGKYTDEQLDELAERFNADGFLTLEGHLNTELLRAWKAAFQPLFDAHMEREGHTQNRGANRHYVTLPFVAPFADPAIFEDPDILGIVERVAGKNPVMCQLASDTPVRGSDYQPIHRDTPPLFPEIGFEPPSYQLAVNFPLIDVTPEHGPVEIARGTHRLPRAEGEAILARGEVQLEPHPMKLGDVMIRDVRGLHRGTPNRTDEPRPMVVIGFSRNWLNRPEVSIAVPRDELAKLSDRAKKLLRTNPIVADVASLPAGERYQDFLH